MKARQALRPAILAASLLAVFSPVNAELLDAPWLGDGTGTTTVVSDGSAGPAEFTYDARAFSGVWNFQSVAGSARTVLLKYRYAGLHAWFAVTAGLDAVVGVQTIPLVSAGPENCCTPPSGGFTYTGTVALPVAVGQSYGFVMRGSNFDFNDILMGSLVVDEVNKDDCKAGGWTGFRDLSGAALFRNQGDCVSFVETGGRNEAGKNTP